MLASVVTILCLRQIRGIDSDKDLRGQTGFNVVGRSFRVGRGNRDLGIGIARRDFHRPQGKGRDSLSIALLIQMLARSSQKNQLVAITGLSAHFQKIFKMVGINKFATIYSSIDEAIQKMSQ